MKPAGKWAPDFFGFIVIKAAWNVADEDWLMWDCFAVAEDFSKYQISSGS